jgi:ABC-2 type transport system permease protein
VSDVPSPVATGTIHDIGYQRYRGVRLGRGYAWRSLYVHGIRTAFGLGRPGKAKIFPWFCASVLLLVSVIMVAIRSETGRMPLTYVDFPQRTFLLILLFVAIAAPELVSRDLRGKILPLYFSRPMHREDYAWAKFASMVSAVWLIIAVPLTLMFVAGAFSLHGAGKIWGEFLDYGKGLLGAGVMALAYASVGVAIASFLGRRMVAAAAIVAAFLVASTVGAALYAVIGGDSGQKIGRLGGPVLLVQSLNDWLFQNDPRHWGRFGLVYLVATALMVGLATLVLLVRYRKVSA